MKTSALTLLMVCTLCLGACSSPEQRAFKQANKEAVSGNAEAQMKLADMYLTGTGTEQNTAEATRWYIQAAQQNRVEAFAWLKQQAYAGNTETAKTMTQMFERGNVHFAHWMLQRAEQGDDQAFYAVGWMYDTGKGLIKDQDKAVYWYKKAAQKNNPDAKKALGNIYFFGKAESFEPEQAIDYLKAAALENRDSDAAIKVAHYYHFDLRDTQQALNWYQKAADYGDKDAQNTVNTFHEWKDDMKNEAPQDIPSEDHEHSTNSAS